MSVCEKMTDIADRLRGYADTTDKLSLDDMTNKIDRTFGEAFWFGSNFNSYLGSDVFWDILQCNGKRTDYYYAFARTNFTDDLLKQVKYKIKPLSAESMFRANTNITDISGIDMDTSGCTDFSGFCMGCNYLTKVGKLNLENAVITTAMFSGCPLLTDVGPLIVSESTVLASNTFLNTLALTTIIFSGPIACDLAFKRSPLSRASIENILDHLSTTSQGQTLTLKSGLVDTAFETSEGAGDGRAVFESLIADKTNWSFSY